MLPQIAVGLAVLLDAGCGKGGESPQRGQTFGLHRFFQREQHGDGLLEKLPVAQDGDSPLFAQQPQELGLEVVKGRLLVLKQTHGEDKLLRPSIRLIFQLGLPFLTTILPLMKQVQSAGEIDIALGILACCLDEISPLVAHKHLRGHDISGIAQGQGDGPSVLRRHPKPFLVALQQLAQV